MAVEDTLLNLFSQANYAPIIFFLFGYMLMEILHKKNIKLAERIILSILITFGLTTGFIAVFYIVGNSPLICGLSFSCIRIIDSMYYISFVEGFIIIIGSLWLIWQWKNGRYKENNYLCAK